jgi:hypothetical protein
MKNIVNVPEVTYGTYNDSFLLWRKRFGGYAWLACRDELLDSFRECRGQFKNLFYCKKGIDNRGIKHIDRVKGFIEDFQDRCGLDVKHRCRVIPTDKAHVICFTMPKFWRTPVRFSLLTALIRIGTIYASSIDDTFAAAHIFAYDCSDEGYGVGYAIRRFMNGYYFVRYPTDLAVNARPAGEFTGWVDLFSSQGFYAPEEIDKILVNKRQIRKMYHAK